MTGLFFDNALLPQGWARNVRLSIETGRIVSLQSESRPAPDDERHRLGLPGLCNLHSHAFQRGMAGLAEIRSTTADNFWTWRELMYRFVERMTPDDIEAIAAQAYVDMLESGFTRVGEFHYVHHDASGAPYRDIAELASRIAAAVALDRDRTDAAAGVLCPCRFRRACTGAAAAALRQRCRRLRAADGGIAPPAVRRSGCRHRYRAAFAARSHPGRARGDLAARGARSDPYSCLRADRGGRGLPRLERRAPGAMAARPCAGRSSAGASFTPPIRRPTSCAAWPRQAQSPGSAP